MNKLFNKFQAVKAYLFAMNSKSSSNLQSSLQTMKEHKYTQIYTLQIEHDVNEH